MPDNLAICRWLEQTSVGASVRQSLWLFPAIETVHLLGMAALLGTIVAFDLRLMGLVMRREPVSVLSRRLLPWAWAGFAVQVATGALLFTSEAVKMYANPAFRLKMLLIALAGLHALIFHFTSHRSIAAWDERRLLPAGARIAGFVSILLWIGVVPPAAGSVLFDPLATLRASSLLFLLCKTDGDYLAQTVIHRLSPGMEIIASSV